MNKSEICARIPHAGSMCLLQQVEHWDQTQIRCLAHSHLDPDNPLRNQGRLSTLTAIEYAGQAIALHGGLMQGTGARPRTGFLASVRNISLKQEHLDSCSDALHIVAKRLAGDQQGYLYEFDVACGGQSLVSGRVMVKLIDEDGEEAASP